MSYTFDGFSIKFTILGRLAEVVDMFIERSVVWSRSVTIAMLLVVLSFCSIPNSSFAACTNDAGAAQNASNFVSNPSSLLSGPNGPLSSAQVSAAVRDFVSASPQALAAVIGLLKDNGVSADQQKAIGTGLGLAASICIRPDPTFAAEIQTQLAGTNSADAKTAYAAVTGNQLIGSVGGAGAGGGSAGSVGGGQTVFSPTSGSGSNFQAFTSNSVSNSPTSFFSGGTTGASSSGTSTTTSNTPTTVVCTISRTC